MASIGDFVGLGVGLVGAKVGNLVVGWLVGSAVVGVLVGYSVGGWVSGDDKGNYKHDLKCKGEGSELKIEAAPSNWLNICEVEIYPGRLPIMCVTVCVCACAESAIPSHTKKNDTFSLVMQEQKVIH